MDGACWGRFGWLVGSVCSGGQAAVNNFPQLKINKSNQSRPHFSCPLYPPSPLKENPPLLGSNLSFTNTHHLCKHLSTYSRTLSTASLPSTSESDLQTIKMREIVSANPSHRSPSKAHQSGIKQEEKKNTAYPHHHRYPAWVFP